jgi:alanine-synthesizing transaminase
VSTDINPLSKLKAIREKFSQEGRRLVDLSMINPDIPPPRILLDKLVEATLQPKNHRYSVSRGTKKLRDAFCDKYLNKFNIRCNAEAEICVSFGTKEAITELFKVATEQNDTILVGSPVYPAYRNAALRAGLNLKTFSCVSSEAEMLKDIAAQIKEHSPKIILLNFPNNPTGITVSAGFFKELQAITKQSGAIIVNDFVYGEMLYSEKAAPSLLCADPSFKNLIETYSLSKAYSIPGWRVGALLGDREIIKKISLLKSDLDYGLFIPLQTAASVALKNEQNFVRPIVEQYKTRVELLVKSLSALGWGIQAPEAGACVWAKLPEAYTEGDATFFAEALLTKYGIALSPGTIFGDAYNRYVRFAAVAPEETLFSVLQAIRDLQGKNHALNAVA